MRCGKRRDRKKAQREGLGVHRKGRSPIFPLAVILSAVGQSRLCASLRPLRGAKNATLTNLPLRSCVASSYGKNVRNMGGNADPMFQTVLSKYKAKTSRSSASFLKETEPARPPVRWGYTLIGGGSAPELIVDASYLAAPVGLVPFDKNPRHFPLSRYAHPVTPLILTPSTFPRCWNQGVPHCAPTRFCSN